MSYFYVGLKSKIISIIFGTKELWTIKNLKSISSYLGSIYSSMFLQKYLLYAVHFYDFRYLWNHKSQKIIIWSMIIQWILLRILSFFIIFQIQKVKQMNELLSLLLSDFIFDINTKSRSLKSLGLKKLRLLRVSTTTEAYEIKKKRSLQTIQSGLVTIVKSL